MENLNIITPRVVWTPGPSASKGGRRPSVDAEGPRASTGTPAVDLLPGTPKSEVVAKKPRRRFSGDYKLRILRELDACQNGSERGLILRREGLYSSTVSNWKKQCKEGALSLLNAKRGRKSEDPHMQRITELEKENEELRKKLKQAEIILDVQKKVSEMFGTSVSENIQDDQQ
jgi:transposase-like protein